MADANAPAEILSADAAATRMAAVRPPPASSASASASASSVVVGQPSSDPHLIAVSVAVPETYFDAAIRAARDREPSCPAAAVERREEARIRDHVLRSLPPATGGDERQVTVTAFPVVAARIAGPAARSGRTRAPAVERAADAAPAGDLVTATWQAMVLGRPSEAPREAWIVIIFVCGGTLALLVGRGGGPVRQPRRRPEQRLDWSAVGADDADGRPAAGDTVSRTAA